MGRKHCGKRRNCSLRAISPFSTVFSKVFKRLVSQGRQKGSLCGNGLRKHPHLYNQTEICLKTKERERGVHGREVERRHRNQRVLSSISVSECQIGERSPTLTFGSRSGSVFTKQSLERSVLYSRFFYI